MLNKVNTSSPNALKRKRDDDDAPEASASKAARTSAPAERTAPPGMPAVRRASTAETPRRPDGQGVAMPRRNSIQTKADWAGTKDNVYDRLGEKVPENTFKGLAALVSVQWKMKESKLVRNTAFAAAKTGLMSYKSAARMMRVPPHVAQVIWLAISDPEVRKIAKMGLEISRANPETNGIPPEGFKPLYDLMKKWGLNNKGTLVDPEKFEARKQFMMNRAAEVDDHRQFSQEIAPRLPGAADQPATQEAQARQAEDNSLAGFLASFFVSASKPEPAPPAG